MDKEQLKQVLQNIVGERMKIKAELETFRWLNEVESGAYEDEINERLERLTQLTKLESGLRKIK